MKFEDFKNRLQNERIELYNFFHNHTWGNDYTNLYLYTLPNTNANHPDRTRQARFGAHFIVKRFCDFGDKGIHLKYESKRSVYLTKHVEIVNNKECFVIRKDVLESLAEDKMYTAYVLFETNDSFAEMIEAKELKKQKYVFYTTKNQQGIDKYYYPIESFPLYEKDFTQPKEDIEWFQPKYLGQYRFTLVVHGYKTDVKVFNEGRLIQAGHFNTITEFFNHFNLAEKGAKLISVQRMYAKQQNFRFKGLTFIFNDDWEVVEYKVRLSKEQKEAIEAIEKAKEALANAEAEEEEIELISPITITNENEDINTIADMSLSSSLINENPPNKYWDEDTREWKECIDIFNL